jgi:arsenate reductase
MAEALVRLLGGDRLEAHSAGATPTQLHPLAVAAMGEIGLDISGQRSNSVDEFAGRPFDYVITLCDEAKEGCPTFPASVRTLHWCLPDPSAAPGDKAARLAVFRQVRDDLAARIRQLIEGAEP